MLPISWKEPVVDDQTHQPTWTCSEVVKQQNSSQWWPQRYHQVHGIIRSTIRPCCTELSPGPRWFLLLRPVVDAPPKGPSIDAPAGLSFTTISNTQMISFSHLPPCCNVPIHHLYVKCEWQQVSLSMCCVATVVTRFVHKRAPKRPKSWWNVCKSRCLQWLSLFSL